MKKTTMVTMMGKRSLSQPGLQQCLNSWKRARFASSIEILSDGTLEHNDLCGFEALSMRMIPQIACDSIVAEKLAKYPHLRLLRERSTSIRKILDIPLWYHERDCIVYADTDVFFLEETELPDNQADLVMGVDDSTTYSAPWKMALKGHLMPGMNCGFMVLSPKKLDFDFLNHMAEKYLLKSASMWTVEQSAWAALMIRMENTAIFSGHDVRLISALGKRTREEILANQYKIFKRAVKQTDDEIIKSLIKGAAIVHMAGYGKLSIHLCEEMRPNESAIRRLTWQAASPVGHLTRISTATRLLLTEFLEKRKKSISFKSRSTT